MKLTKKSLNSYVLLAYCPAPQLGSYFAPPIGFCFRFAIDRSGSSPTSRLGTLLLPVGFAFSLHLVACCRGDLRVSVSSSASPLASRFGSLSFSQLSFLAFWFCLLFFLPKIPNQSSLKFGKIINHHYWVSMIILPNRFPLLLPACIPSVLVLFAILLA